MDEARLSRMEAKIDKLADAMSTLVRVEERVLTIFKRLDGNDERAAKIDARLGVVERAVEGRGHALRFLERIFWIVTTAAVAAGFAYLRP